MIFLEKPYSFLSTKYTSGLYEYLYKLVEKLNIELNSIDPDQIEREKLVSFIQKATEEGASVTNRMEIPVSGSNNLAMTIVARKTSGIVFLTIGNMAYVPANTTTTLTTLPKTYWPQQTEYLDYATPGGNAFRFTVAKNGTVSVQNYSNTLSASIDSQVRMAYPAV